MYESFFPPSAQVGQIRFFSLGQQPVYNKRQLWIKNHEKLSCYRKCNSKRLVSWGCVASYSTDGVSVSGTWEILYVKVMVIIST